MVSLDRNKRKRKLQKKFKDSGYYLNYSKRDSWLRVHFQPNPSDEHCLVVGFEVNDYTNLPLIKIKSKGELTTRDDVQKEEIEWILDELIKEFTFWLEAYGYQFYGVETSMVSGKVEVESFIADYLKKKYVPVHEKTGYLAMYLTPNAGAYFKYLRDIGEYFIERSAYVYFTTSTPEYKVRVERSYPNSLYMTFKEDNGVDNNVFLKVNFHEQVIEINIKSPYYKEKKKVDKLSVPSFLKMYEEFKEKQRFKMLFEKPKMNDAIRASISSLLREVEYYTKEDRLHTTFEFLTKYFELPEMNRLAEERTEIRRVYRVNFNDKELETMDDAYSIIYKRTEYECHVCLFWNKYILFLKSKDEEKRSEIKLFDEKEKAIQYAKEKLTQYILG